MHVHLLENTKEHLMMYVNGEWIILFLSPVSSISLSRGTVLTISNCSAVFIEQPFRLI